MLQKTNLVWFSDEVVKRFFKLSIVFIVIQLASLGVFFTKLSPVVPLFYSLPWGDVQLAPAYFIFIFPILSIAIGLGNSLILFVSPMKEVFFQRMVIGFWLLTTVLATIGLIKIVLLIA